MDSQDETDWDKLYLCLYAYTDGLLRKRRWFRKTEDGSTIKGKQVHDYVSDGIERYLTAPEKYDPSKGALDEYIKFNIIRGIVSNDFTSAENKTSLDVLAFVSEEDADTGADYQETILPYVVALIEQQMDYDRIMPCIEEEVKGDAVVENVLLGITMDLKRREIMEEFEMSEQEYANGIRRLNTIQKNIAKKFHLEQA
jgi:hypothetical protein